MDGVDCRLHWQAALLPVLSSGELNFPGFRPNALGFWCKDRREVLTNDTPIQWLRTENWGAEELSSRGRLSQPLRGMRVVIVGCGAVGCAIGELLARAGVERFTVIDSDDLRAGNLVRHTLTQADLGKKKAEALAARLVAISPHVIATPINDAFPPTSDEDRRAVAESDLVIDCTGDDTTLAELERFPWETAGWFASVSIGIAARRIFCFLSRAERFPHAQFRDAIGPWLLREREEGKDFEFPWEGIGCWHPVFPARADDVWLLAASAVKHLEGAVARLPEPAGQLTVFEQVIEDGAFVGVRRVSLGGDV